MTDKQTLAQSLRRYGSDFISHAASRGIEDIEAAGELMLEAARALAEPVTQCWKCGDVDPAGHAKCNVPACGMREDTQPAKREPRVHGVLFAVEQAIQNGDCPWQIEQAFDEYEAERKSGTKE